MRTGHDTIVCNSNQLKYKIYKMKRSIKFMFAAVLGLAAVSCGSPEKMAEMAENVTIKCEPAVLEVVGGNIDAKVSVTYPEDYFHPKAILEVTPVIVYEGGEQAMEPFVFQGEKVKDNYEVIPSEGATVTKNVHFTLFQVWRSATLSSAVQQATRLSLQTFLQRR